MRGERNTVSLECQEWSPDLLHKQQARLEDGDTVNFLSLHLPLSHSSDYRLLLLLSLLSFTLLPSLFPSLLLYFLPFFVYLLPTCDPFFLFFSQILIFTPFSLSSFWFPNPCSIVYFVFSLPFSHSASVHICFLSPSHFSFLFYFTILYFLKFITLYFLPAFNSSSCPYIPLKRCIWVFCLCNCVPEESIIRSPVTEIISFLVGVWN